jgi:beta-1,4-mannosyl-glycoprotein beta-1,4-N-acetylglucosaminyltransferase
MKKIFDCFPFFNELELLEVRLNTLYDFVEKFILVESNLTHQHEPKPLYYEENKQRFEKFSDKIIHLVFDATKVAKIPWNIELKQRNWIVEGLKQCDISEDDLIISSDLDEIINPEVILKNINLEGVTSLSMPVFYYYLNYLYTNPWLHPVMFPYKELTDKKVSDFRDFGDHRINQIDDAGWHFSFMGGVERIITKLESFAHSEYNEEEFKNPEHIKDCIENKKSIFNEEGILKVNGGKFFNPHSLIFVTIDNGYPKYIVENIEYFKSIGWIKERDTDARSNQF